MPNLTIGVPLPDDETWLREITNQDHITRAGVIHHQFIKRSLTAPTDETWAHEVSGRALSLAGDILSHGLGTIDKIKLNHIGSGKPVPTKITFVGIAKAKAKTLRSFPNPASNSDVIFTPNDDPAHSDFILYSPLDDQGLDEAFMWLQKVLVIARADTLKPA